MEDQRVDFTQSTPAPLPSLSLSESARSQAPSARSPRPNFMKTASPRSMAKSARTLRRPETQRSINNGNRKRINPVLSMSQRICPEIQQVSIQFATLAVLIRNFLTDNTITTLCPSLPNIFTVLSLSFDTYCHQCTLMFSNVTRAPSQRNFHQGSPVYVQGKLLMTKWVNFIETINNLVDTGVEPYRDQIHKYIVEYKNVMKTAIDFISRTQYYPQPLVNALKKICQRANNCEKKLTVLFNKDQKEDNPQNEEIQNNDQIEAQEQENDNQAAENPTEQTEESEEDRKIKYIMDNYKEFVYPNRAKEKISNTLKSTNKNENSDDYQTMFYNLIDATTTLFEQTLPKDSIPIRRAVKLKIKAINQCAMIIELINAIEQFHTATSRIKQQITNVNSELNKVHQQLNLPFTVTLTIDNSDGKKEQPLQQVYPPEHEVPPQQEQQTE